MKKILALIAASVASIAIAAADPIVVGHGYLGFGALGTTFNYDEMTPYPGMEDKDPSVFGAFFSNLEYGAGASINIPFGGYFGVQAGVDFYVNSAGFKTDYTTLTFTYTSLDIPLLFTAKLEKWNFALGPYLSIPLGNVTATTSSRTETYKNGRKINFGITAGVGYEERLGMGRIVFGGRYMLDFLDNFVDDPDNFSGKSEFKFTRRALLIDIGYKLPLSFFGL
ncbi:MAG: porin family protein [Treponema sp.]|nr:porin family protein [Treponema sp.]